MGIKLANNAFGTLASGIASGATSITLTTGHGARFPSLGAGDYFYATLIDTSNNLEIVKCTARSTDVLTVTRAQEGTTARAYSAGDRLEIRITAQTFVDAVNEIGPTQVSDEANTSTGYFDLPSGTTAQRPASPTAGMIRHNTTTGSPEWYDSVGTTWRDFSFDGDAAPPVTIPAGCVAHFAMSAAPSGWVKANGAAVSRTTYAALFSAIGVVFGAGDGSTTFNLPDLRGEFLRGWADGRGVDSGRGFGTWQADEFKSHTHTVGEITDGTRINSSYDDEYDAKPSSQTGATGGSETRPRNVALLACIKY